ncbi:MAG: hypothetical protein ABSE51_13345 [Terracidiphilus sp.]|jgi:hypothetical protein
MQCREVAKAHGSNTKEMGDKKPRIERDVFSKKLELRKSEADKYGVCNDAAKGERAEKGKGMRNCGNQQGVKRQHRWKYIEPPKDRSR